jgi:FkbM family methyltransferase
MNISSRQTIQGALQVVCDFGWRPGAIIDIGVAKRTEGLYEVWPGVPICLVEPSLRSLPFMQEIAATFPNVQIFNVGASDRTGERTGYQHPSRPFATFSDRKARKWGEPVSMPTMTCDDIVKSAGIEPPFVYKLDTDTHDREVLAGSEETLARSDLCILEMKLYNAVGFATPDDVWQTVTRHGLVFYDLVTTLYGLDNVLRAVDMIFVRKDSALHRLAAKHSKKKYDERARF